jgi:hypothetical protein
MNIRKIFEKNIAGKRVLIFFLLAMAVYLTMLLGTIPYIMSFSGELNILDMMPAGYDAAYVNQLFTQLGDKGRNAYLYFQIPLDLVYPALYGIGFSLVLAWFLNRLGKMGGNFVYLCLLPVAAGFFDYSENIGIIAMLRAFPEIPSNLVVVTNLFSILKSSITSIYFIILIAVIVIFAVKSVMKKDK